jgi:hypothetical protein
MTGNARKKGFRVMNTNSQMHVDTTTVAKQVMRQGSGRNKHTHTHLLCLPLGCFALWFVAWDRQTKTGEFSLMGRRSAARTGLGHENTAWYVFSLRGNKAQHAREEGGGGGERERER